MREYKSFHLARISPGNAVPFPINKVGVTLLNQRVETHEHVLTRRPRRCCGNLLYRSPRPFQLQPRHCALPSAKDFTKEQLGTSGNAGTDEICNSRARFALCDQANVRVDELMNEYTADKDPLPGKQIGIKTDGTNWRVAVLQDGSQRCEVQVYRWKIPAAESKGIGKPSVP